MSQPAIKVEGLSKEYRIGGRERGKQTFREMIVDAVRTPFRGVTSLKGQVTEQERFWALRDVSFEVMPGEVVGIVGRNGAGKSTLLKILSRITEPTHGEVQIRGRVASLLEVGTGFHPELTGRENIFLNGAILGMSRREIQRKFDEIVAFSEIEKFLDTPVKRYSSGMYVRLAFAVAAYLEPDILLVDEVLAVGDTEFQKKCLGKMRDVAASEGRTVLFVSHNMAAIKSLTARCVLLKDGQVAFCGPSLETIELYTKSAVLAESGSQRSFGAGTHTSIKHIQIIDDSGVPTRHYESGRDLCISIRLEKTKMAGLSLELFLVDAMGAKLGLASLHQFHGEYLPTPAGEYELLLRLQPLWLAAGSYSFDVTTSIVNASWDHYVSGAAAFDVEFCNPLGQSWNFQQSYGYGQQALLFASPIDIHTVTATDVFGADERAI